MTEETVIYRIAPASVIGFTPKPAELALNPPGVSVLSGGTAAEAMAAMRAVYPRSKKWKGAAAVSTATAAMVRAVGFDVIDDPSSNFPNHARITHPLGAAGFTDANLAALAAAFTESLV